MPETETSINNVASEFTRKGEGDRELDARNPLDPTSKYIYIYVYIIYNICTKHIQCIHFTRNRFLWPSGKQAAIKSLVSIVAYQKQG